MPEWSDSAIILSVHKHAENNAVVSFLTQNHGRHSGLCKSAFSKRNAGTFQPGNLVQVAWNARLDEHLGTAKVELLTSYAAGVLSDADRLTVLSSLCTLSRFLPEREAVPEFFQQTLEMIALLGFEEWEERYARWEVELLAILGFGLDLSACAVTGETDDLVYVSPKSGRAVSKQAGQAWHDKLLALPAFLLDNSVRPENPSEIEKALILTGFFLENYAAKAIDCSVPAVRRRLIERLRLLKL